MPLSISRKRTRSETENDYTVQSKQFINEQTVNMNSETKMKEIHGKCNNNNITIKLLQIFNFLFLFQFVDKTIRMLFQNANKSGEKVNNNNNNEIAMTTVQHPMSKWQQFGETICLMGDGQVNYIDADAAKCATENVSRRCRFCAKPSAIQATDCINCNLEICEFCGISCMQCNAPLCMSCVQLL